MLPSEPIPSFLNNGIMIYFLNDARFMYIQKRYDPDKSNWLKKVFRKPTNTKDNYEDFEEDNYYVHKHKDIIKIDTGTVKRNNDNKNDGLIPSTNIWIGLLRTPITTGNIHLYYTGKYTQLKGTFDLFLSRYFQGLKSIITTKTQGDVSNKEDVLVEKWYVYSDLPCNQSVFIL